MLLEPVWADEQARDEAACAFVLCGLQARDGAGVEVLPEYLALTSPDLIVGHDSE